MNVSRNNDRFNDFWVVMFSFMVGYLIYFFVGHNIANNLVKDKDVGSFIGVFFMSSCIVIIYMVLTFLLERTLPMIFKYVLWGHYYALFFIMIFCLNIGEEGFILKPFEMKYYKDSWYIAMILKSVMLFIPIGYLVRREVFIKSISFVVLLILTIEFSQTAFKLGKFDVNEIVFSCIGVCIGYFSFRKKVFVRQKKRNRNMRRA